MCQLQQQLPSPAVLELDAERKDRGPHQWRTPQDPSPLHVSNVKVDELSARNVMQLPLESARKVISIALSRRLFLIRDRRLVGLPA